jgi:hypothetical protein
MHCGALNAGAQSFNPGDIFLSVHGLEGCHLHVNWIVRVNPVTGIATDIASYDDGLCSNDGLRFTPDGESLRVLNEGFVNVLDFTPAGNGSVVYDSQNGLPVPAGGNGLEWGSNGNFYVAGVFPAQLVRFAPGGTMPAQIWPLPRTGGALIYTPRGELFYAYDNVYRVSGTNVELFDQLVPQWRARSLAVTHRGDLIVDTGDVILRYEDAQAAQRTVVAQNLPLSEVVAIALAANDRTLYRICLNLAGGPLIGIDLETGSYEVIYTLPELRLGGYGIAVYIPPIRGDMNCSRRLDNFDIDPFVVALTDPAAYAANYSWRDRNLADVNGDGAIDNFDIDPFVRALVDQPLP